MDNKSAFNVSMYDENVRKVIPFYDEIYEQIFSLIKAYFSNKQISVLDSGCGTGTFGLNVCKKLNVSELILCDPSEKMLEDAKRKLEGYPCEFIKAGSEELDFENRFDLVTAIQSHHYFKEAERNNAIKNCFRALKHGGLFICFENTAPFSDAGREIMLRRVEEYGLRAGRTFKEVKSHSARYGQEFFPITVSRHLELLHESGFETAELLWHSYMQSGFYAIKK